MKRVIWFALFLVVGVSCLDQPDCFRQDLNLIGISFRKMYDGTADTVRLVNVTADSEIILTDTVLSLSTISLPLDYLKTNTTFAIEQLVYEYLTGKSQKDTISVSHSSRAQFVSEDCGERFVVSNLSLLRSTYDSIEVVSSTPSNPAHINIKVYRCPRTNILRMSFRQLYMDKTDTASRGKLDPRPITSVINSGTTWLKDVTASTVLLPLNPDATSTTYDFKFENGDSNSVTLNYHIDKKQIIPKCPTQNLYSQLTPSTSTNSFKILKISKDTLQDPPATNVETFRCPTTNEIKISFKQIRGSSKVTDTLHIVSLKTDYLGDSSIYVQADTSAVTLPLNPAANTTKYTFNVTGEATSSLTLQLKYTTTTYVFHSVCGAQTIFSALAIDDANTSFYSANMVTLLPDVRFPSVTNIEITRK